MLFSNQSPQASSNHFPPFNWEEALQYNLCQLCIDGDEEITKATIPDHNCVFIIVTGSAKTRHNGTFFKFFIIEYLQST